VTQAVLKAHADMAELQCAGWIAASWHGGECDPLALMQFRTPRRGLSGNQRMHLRRHRGGRRVTCPYKPLEFNVVIELDPVEEKTAGGIILISATKEADKLACEEGTLVAISPHAFSYAEWGDTPKPEVGQRVMIKRYDGILREREIAGVKRTYRIVQDKIVVALIEEQANG
jgi:co-chaperonin GroES (HSP10)